MKANEIVRAYAALTARCLDEMRLHFYGFDKQSVFSSRVFVPRDGTSPVSTGRLGEMGTFRVHGRGCSFELDTGEDLDVDWDDDGRAIFSSWRMLAFAQSIGEDHIDRESLRMAASSDAELRQIEADWFTWADSRFDISSGSEVIE